MNKDGNTILVPAVLILLSQTKVDILFKTKYIYSMHFYNLIVSFKSSSIKRSSLLPMIT